MRLQQHRLNKSRTVNTPRLPRALLVAVLVLAWPQTAATQANALAHALASDQPKIRVVMSSLAKHELQIIYTQIDRDQNGTPSFRTQSFQLNPDFYFYPASTIKFPVALLAVEQIEANGLTIDSVYTLEGEENSRRTVAGDIALIFSISDNEAYNRLYELVGRDRANQRLSQLGYTSTRIAHRLATERAANPQRKTIKYLNTANQPFLEFTGSDKAAIPVLSRAGLEKGVAFIEDGELTKKPLDFSKKNAFSLSDQHQLLKDFLFGQDALNISAEARRRIRSAMAMLPKENDHDPLKFYDSYGKFFLYGDDQSPMPGQVKIYNKVGYAYGTLTDNAYIVDAKNNIEFLLSATILVNENGVFNDDDYQYDEIGIPFLAELGRQLYQAELRR